MSGRDEVGALTVLAPGALTTVQDLGRPGWWRSGVGVSGALDRGACRLANRLVGNPEDAAVLENLGGGLALRATRTLLVAVTGAGTVLRVDGRPRSWSGAVTTVPAGSELSLDVPRSGLRCCLAVRGGIDVAPVLGSRSRDTLAALGPPPLEVGQRLPVGVPAGPWPVLDSVPLPTGDLRRVRARPGPRADWFRDPDVLLTTCWRVSTCSDRVGLRLEPAGGALPRRVDPGRELPSEGIALGSVQVPPDGRPAVMLADHPVTGGYPVLATVLDADVDRLAQARPGDVIGFVPG
ncbi:5-oxoprolinase subunit C family protein [Auraticoccus monumenti]|uniref:Biotin-dependent carboxylase uncharacterized domain-containing protein n=1 Tax=Auraticoccus monumenti TaxID=675864 RepID=A0A1G7BL65_9ACTN|nr:biotin-dependent carboxyltransferase family protein [Auraticoccus monumenti]SDE27662.1 biotin-dependent carboxylase uncharacterized domain-containing protein [Auraticoccus monumenti]